MAKSKEKICVNCKKPLAEDVPQCISHEWRRMSDTELKKWRKRNKFP